MAQVSRSLARLLISIQGLACLAACGSVEKPDATLIVCSESTVTSPLGEQTVREERYHADAMNAELAKNPSLMNAMGTSAVRSCDDARRFTEVRNELARSGGLVEQLHEPTEPLDWEAILAETEELDAEMRALGSERIQPIPSENEAQASGPIEKVVDGYRAISDRVMLFHYSPGGMLCSATAIGKRVVNGNWWTSFLTAAHCIDRPPTWEDHDAKYYYGTIVMYHTTNAANTAHFGTFGAYFVYRDDYTGRGDHEDAIGFITVNMGSYEYPDKHLSPILNNREELLDTEQLRQGGFGTSTPNSYRYNLGRSNFIGDEGRLGIWILDNDDPYNRVCHGDDGGPAYAVARSDAPVAGISVHWESAGSAWCSDRWEDKYWLLPAYYVYWLEQFHGRCRKSTADIRCW